MPAEAGGFKLPSINVVVRVAVRSPQQPISILGIMSSVAEIVTSLNEDPGGKLDGLKSGSFDDVYAGIGPAPHACVRLTRAEAATVIEGVGTYMRQEILFRPVVFKVHRRGVGPLAGGKIVKVGNEAEGGIEVFK